MVPTIELASFLHGITTDNLSFPFMAPSILDYRVLVNGFLGISIMQMLN